MKQPQLESLFQEVGAIFNALSNELEDGNITMNQLIDLEQYLEKALSVEKKDEHATEFFYKLQGANIMIATLQARYSQQEEK